MNILCVGAGPGGLYLAILLKRRRPDWEVTVLERNPRGRTHGWGIVFWDELLGKLQAADPQSAAQIRAASTRWSGQALLREGREQRCASAGGYGLARHRMIEILADRAAELGVRLRYETDAADPAQLGGADLVVACDGAGSELRKRHEAAFRPQVATGANKYIWLGVKHRFEPFIFAFRRTPAGPVWFHGYSYGEMSTCVVECGPGTWAGLGFDRMAPEAAAAALSEIFAGELAGQPLMAGESCWQSFRTVRTRTLVSGRTVLLGDAAHTAHFSIGSGTRLALEDAIALAGALQRESEVGAALAAYDEERRTAAERIQKDARASAAWFEAIERCAGLTDAAFFAALLDRRSRLTALVPPRLFGLIARATRRWPLLRRLRSLAGAVRVGLASAARSTRERSVRAASA